MLLLVLSSWAVPAQADGDSHPAKPGSPSKQGGGTVVLEPLSKGETLANRARLGLNAALTGTVMYRIAEQMHSTQDVLDMGQVAATAYLGASLATAFFHWGVDNFGKADPNTFLGAVIAAFRDHHYVPRLVGYESVSRASAAGQKAGVPLLAALAAVPLGADADTAALVVINAAIYTSWIHSLSHRPPSRLNLVERGLQAVHLFLPRRNHAKHHEDLHKNYDVLTGLGNYILPERLFSAMEYALHKGTGVVPETWVETKGAERLAFKTGRLLNWPGVSHRLRAVPRLMRTKMKGGKAR